MLRLSVHVPRPRHHVPVTFHCISPKLFLPLLLIFAFLLWAITLRWTFIIKTNHGTIENKQNTLIITPPASPTHHHTIETTTTTTKPRILLPPTHILFITSITRPFRDHAEEVQWRHTIWEKRTPPVEWPPNSALWIYTENTWEIQHHRQTLTCNDFPYLTFDHPHEDNEHQQPKCTIIDVFRDIAINLNAIEAPIRRFYTLPFTPGLNTRIMDGMVLVRKVASIVDALDQLPDGRLLIWMDVDVQLARPLDQQFIEFCSSRDVSYLPETVCWRDTPTTKKTFFDLPPHCRDIRIDTGIIVFRASAITRKFAHWWFEAFGNGLVTTLAIKCLGQDPVQENESDVMPLARVLELFSMESTTGASWQDVCSQPTIRSNLGLNDIYVFALTLMAFHKDLEHGWFAAPQRTSHCGQQQQPDPVTFPGGHCHPCPTSTPANAHAESLVSPFNVFRYLSHVKGGHGIMSRQHTFHESTPKTKTSDVELTLPQEYFPIQPQHVDHRMACGDKRATWGKRWSLNQPA